MNTLTCHACLTKASYPQSNLKATGYPVAVHVVTCPSCSAFIAEVNDFGNCNGIKKVKGFTKILAEQKAAIRMDRRELNDVIQPLRRAADKKHARIRGHQAQDIAARRQIYDDLHVSIAAAWAARRIRKQTEALFA